MLNPWKALSRIHPELNNGYRQIESSVLRALIRSKMTATELRICLAVIDKTWGYKLTWDYISAGYLAKMTGINRRNIQRCLEVLAENRVLIIESRGPRRASKIMLNKYHDTWLNLTVPVPPDLDEKLTVPVPPDEENLTVSLPPDEKNDLTVPLPPADGPCTSSPDGACTATINKKETINIKSRAGKRKSRLDYSSDIQIASSSLKNSLLKIKPDRKPIPESQLITWMDDIRKLQDIDQIDIDRIQAVVEWLPNCQDKWIRQNIGSAGFVRKWFDRLESEMRTPPKQTKVLRERQALANWLHGKGAEHG